MAVGDEVAHIGGDDLDGLESIRAEVDGSRPSVGNVTGAPSAGTGGIGPAGAIDAHADVLDALAVGYGARKAEAGVVAESIDHRGQAEVRRAGVDRETSLGRPVAPQVVAVAGPRLNHKVARSQSAKRVVEIGILAGTGNGRVDRGRRSGWQWSPVLDFDGVGVERADAVQIVVIGGGAGDLDRGAVAGGVDRADQGDYRFIGRLVYGLAEFAHHAGIVGAVGSHDPEVQGAGAGYQAG